MITVWTLPPQPQCFRKTRLSRQRIRSSKVLSDWIKNVFSSPSVPERERGEENWVEGRKETQGRKKRGREGNRLTASKRMKCLAIIDLMRTLKACTLKILRHHWRRLKNTEVRKVSNIHRRLNSVSMTICGFSAISINTPVMMFSDRKIHPTDHREKLWILNSWSHLEKFGGLTLSNFKMHYKVAVTKTA